MPAKHEPKAATLEGDNRTFAELETERTAKAA